METGYSRHARSLRGYSYGRGAVLGSLDFRAGCPLYLRHGDCLALSTGTAGKMPKLIALVFTLLLTFAVLSLLALAVAWGSSQVGQWLLRNLDRFQFIYIKRTNGWRGTAFFNRALADRFDVAWLVGFAQQVAARLNSMTGFALLIFAFTILGLMEVDQVA